MAYLTESQDIIFRPDADHPAIGMRIPKGVVLKGPGVMLFHFEKKDYPALFAFIEALKKKEN